ncbi:methionine--tRNA ligase [candidate division WWE3 bacterium]|nr:methionine--tRNA ligase [candidate division WWE3 bacterium]
MKEKKDRQANHSKNHSTKKTYITTAIPYVNAAPHIGFALEIIQADVLNRYYKSKDQDTYFVTGTDENSLKNVLKAEEEGISTKELVNKYSKNFLELKEILNIDYDDFIRTTEPRHIKNVEKFWKACEKDIYKKSYKGLYCVGCEEFKLEKDLEEGKCPEHLNKALEVVEEENYFFKLSKYQKQLKELIETETLKIVPKGRKNDVLGFIDQGLEDFSISRSVERAKGWGIPVPGDPSQIIYVWFDALVNYISALGYAEESALYKDFWADSDKILHCIGKGITRFHAIYWPAMLLSAGVRLPTHELVHGYITADGQKMSKSLGNVVEPKAVVEKYGTDAVRYFLLKAIPPTKDGDFNKGYFEEVYNADLANGLGNAVARVAKMAENSGFEFEVDTKGFEKVWEADWTQDLQSHMESFRLDLAIQEVWKMLSQLDKHINEHEPWAVKDEEKLREILDFEVNLIRRAAVVLKPFIPDTSRKIQAQFFKKDIKAQKPLFPRI